VVVVLQDIGQDQKVLVAIVDGLDEDLLAGPDHGRLIVCGNVRHAGPHDPAPIMAAVVIAAPRVLWVERRRTSAADAGLAQSGQRPKSVSEQMLMGVSVAT